MDNTRLYSPKKVQEVIDKYEFEFSKSLGQNFLIDGNIVRNIRKSAGITKDDMVVEVGPGIGTLTEELALNSKKVVAVEIDKSLISVLDDSLSKYDNVEIIHKDILDVDIDELIKNHLDNEEVKVVANLPYYITTPIIGKFLENNYNIKSLTIMVQREIAERMVAKAGSKTYGALSVFINYYTRPSIEFIVPKTVFMPQPNVESAVIRLDLKKDIKDTDRKLLFELVKASFHTRRKTIVNSIYLSGFRSLEKDEIKAYLKKANVDPGKRAEDLDIEDYINITEVMK